MPLTEGEQRVDVGRVVQRRQHERPVGLPQRGSVRARVSREHFSAPFERLLEELDEVVAPARAREQDVHVIRFR